MSQESWPFIDAPHEDGCPATEEAEFEDGLQPHDVFIVEGRQERYASKRAWELAC